MSKEIFIQDILKDVNGKQFFFVEPEYDHTETCGEDIELQRMYITERTDILTDPDNRRYIFQRSIDERGFPNIDEDGDEILDKVYIDFDYE